MRCSNCGKKLKKKSNFCVKCGAKVPPLSKNEIKVLRKKARGKFKIAAVLVVILGGTVFSLLTFAADLLPEKISENKGFVFVSDTVKGKLPDGIKLPFDLGEKLPFDLGEKLPFDLPSDLPFDLPKNFALKLPFDLPFDVPYLADNSGKGDHGVDQSDAKDDNEISSKEHEGSKKDSKEEDADKETVKEEPPKSPEPVIKWNEKEQELIKAGMDNQIILSDKNLYADITPVWSENKIKVQEHQTDLVTGTDTVILYLELKNDYVNMTGTKEVTYQYNEETGDWEQGTVSKIKCLTVEPINKDTSQQS